MLRLSTQPLMQPCIQTCDLGGWCQACGGTSWEKFPQSSNSQLQMANSVPSNGKQCTCHCFSAHSVIKGAYLVFLRSFASCMCSSGGTVSSPMMRTLAAPDHMTRSGRRRVMAATTGKTSLPDRSDSTFQLQPPCRILTFFSDLPAYWSMPPPSDTKWMCLTLSLSPDSWFATYVAFSTAFAMTRRTWSCLQVYIPCPRALGQALRMCCSVPCPSHMPHLLELASFHWVRFAGVGRRSYTERRRKETPCCSIDHRSLHVSLFCSTPSHLVKAPCLLCPTALVRRLCSSCTISPGSWLVTLTQQGWLHHAGGTCTSGLSLSSGLSISTSLPWKPCVPTRSMPVISVGWLLKSVAESLAGSSRPWRTLSAAESALELLPHLGRNLRMISLWPPWPERREQVTLYIPWVCQPGD